MLNLTKLSFFEIPCSMDKNRREGRMIMPMDLDIFHFMKSRPWSSLAALFQEGVQLDK